MAKAHIALARWAKKGALDSQLQVIKFTSCLLMVSGSLRVLDFFQTSTTKTGRHDIAEILLKMALNQSATLHTISTILP